MQHSLGLAYQDRIIGDDKDKHRRAIAHFNASLLVYDRSHYPMQVRCLRCLVPLPLQ